MLQRLAPLAGKPVPDVRRASQDEHRGAPPASAEPQQEMPMPVEVPDVNAPPPAELFQAIASIPGASPLVQQVFGGGA
jgi:hypothetical protein